MMGRAAVVKRGTKGEAEKPFWISYADLMTALMVLFLVAMSVAMMTVTYNAEDVERQRQELQDKTRALEEKTRDLEEKNARLIVDEEKLRKSEADLQAKNEELERLRKSAKELEDERASQVRNQEIAQLLEEVERAASRYPGVKVDKNKHTIDFGDRARFEKMSSSLTTDQGKLLRTFVPGVLAIANDHLGQKWLKQVVVEGFASPEGDYLYNLNLSLQRSQRVLCTLLATSLPDDTSLASEQRDQIRDLFLVGGFSFNAVKYDEATKSYDASRRVELRLEFLGINESRPSPVAAANESLGKCALN